MKGCKMKTYRVAIAYQEGFTMQVQANSEEEAEEMALDMVDEKASVDMEGLKIDTVHRDYHTC